MQKSILYLDKKQGQTYHAIFKNNHGRRLYIQLQINNNEIFISDCFYTDRHARNGHNAVPCKFHTSHCTCDSLIDVFKNELDKTFFGIEFSDTENKLSTEEYIKLKTQVKTKYKFLILVNDNNTYKTRLKIVFTGRFCLKSFAVETKEQLPIVTTATKHTSETTHT